MLLQHGKSLSIYYMKHCLFYMNIDKAIAAADFYRFLEESLDDVSDGKALYYDHQAMYYLSIGEEEKALEAAKLIFAGKLKSNALPQATYHDFIRYYLEHEQYAHAMHYAFLMERRVLCDPYYLDIIGTLMSLYSITKPPHGIKLFGMHYPLYEQSKNPSLKMQFAIGAYHLFCVLDSETHHDILEELRIARDTPLFTKPPEQIAKYFYHEAETAVQKFDMRNGTTHFSEMLQPQQLIQNLHAMEHGAARLEATADAIAQADSADAHYWRLYFRYEYLTESNIHGDNFKGLLCFPEYLKIFDEHPELEEDMYHDVMWAFKWLLDDAPDFYQISLDEVENYFEEFKKRSQKYGFSLRTYHMKHAKFYLTFNQDLAQIAYANFKHYPRSENSDCEACELNFDMEFALSQNDIETALRIAQPILEGRKKCAEIPHVTYAHLSNYYLYHDNPEEALYYGILCENIIQNRAEFLKETGQLLELYSVMNVGHGWKLFKYGIEHFMRCKNPVMRLSFARGAWRLLEKMTQSTEYAQSNFLSLLPVMKEKEGWPVKALADFFYEIADDISRRMDNRNESDYYMNLLRFLNFLIRISPRTDWCRNFILCL